MTDIPAIHTRHTQQIYEDRYAGDYRSRLEGYERARWNALEHFVGQVAKQSGANTVLDYGAGRGLFIPLWELVFPRAELWFCDISTTALARLVEDYPRYEGRCIGVNGHEATAEDGAFEVVVSVEVIEHVEDLRHFLQDVYRLLKPGGKFIWTTPCGNRFSIEHLYALVTQQIDVTADGSRRWRWEDPTHLRRLRTSELREVLRDVGFTDITVRFRSHLFSFLVTYALPRVRPRRVRAALSRFETSILDFDYRLLRLLPNGASMIGCATKLGEVE